MTNPARMTATGAGWKNRLIELGADSEEAKMLAMRLKEGMAAQIDRDALLAALQFTLQEITHQIENGEMSSKTRSVLGGVRDGIRAAISKAEG